MNLQNLSENKYENDINLYIKMDAKLFLPA